MISKKKAHNLDKILTIKSGMTIEAQLSNFEGIHKVTGQRRIGNACRFVYGIEGEIDKLDLTASTIENLINSMDFDLRYLNLKYLY
jgi:hypothetical protein